MNKMKYVISVLNEITDNETVVVSPCETTLYKYVKGSYTKIAQNVSLKTFDSLRSKYKLLRAFGYGITKLQFILYLLRNIRSADTIVVYHSLALMRTIRAIKKIKKCNLIIEAEELYSDVTEDEKLRKKEIQYLQIADKYIVITELLNKQINLSGKTRIISHGTYRTNPKYSDKFDDGKVHVVYAGSFDPIKGGGISAIESAAFLDKHYVLHILGKGTPSQNEMMIHKIAEISQKTECEIVFEGYKTGKEFDAFIQSCHIGLSTQQPDGKYNASSFPSKVLMYMSNGLPVVSVRIPAIETSEVGEYVYYYDTPSPENIAQAIQSVPLDKDLNVSDKLDTLDKEFKEGLAELLQF